MISQNFLLIPILINFFFIIFFKQITKIFKIKDFPDQKRKFQKEPVLLIGGTFLIINLLAILILSPITNYILLDNSFFSSKREYFAFIFGTVSFYIFGLYDDKYDLSANAKLLILLILINFIVLIDGSLVIKEINFSFLEINIELKSLSHLFTILCIMLFANALNMFDGINLQTGFYSLLIFCIFIYKSIFVNLSFVMIISLFFILYLNYRNKIYLGESGIQFLAFIISYIFIKSSNYNSDIFYADEIFIIMAIPGLDMFRLFLLRILSGKHPFKPDRQHLHHYLGNFFGKFHTFLIIFIYIFFTILFYYIFENKITYLTIYFFVYFFFTILLVRKIRDQ